jgi:uncharacterized LabA/DUF88 family protein
MTNTVRDTTVRDNSVVLEPVVGASAPLNNKLAQVLVKASWIGQSREPSVVLGDSPNATKTVISVFGSAARPDWQAILRLGRSLGNPTHGIIAVNDGLPRHISKKFRAMGYAVQISHAWDVDDRVVAQAVRMVSRAQVFVLVSGDGGYCSLVTILKRLGKPVIVVAVESCCHPNLRAIADEFLPMPVLFPVQRSHQLPRIEPPNQGLGYSQ